MARYEAYINKDWQESGQAFVVAARLRDNGTVEMGALLLDCWCVGVREAFFVSDYAEGDFRDALRADLPDDLRQPIHPACAKKLVEGAVAYAEQLGFAPPRDYKKARRVFSGIEASACPETFTYGKDGKPFFVASEEDEPERIERVLSILEARCGKDGFHYILPGEDEEEAADGPGFGDDAEDPLVIRDALFVWLEDQPEGVPRFYEVSGLLTGMQLCPEVIMPTKVLEVLWGREGRPWKNEEELKTFLNLLKAYWNGVCHLIMNGLESVHPDDQHPIDVWEEDFDDDGDWFAAQSEWAAGFMRATEVWQDVWSNALARTELIPEWAVIEWWAEFKNLSTAEEVAAYVHSRPSRSLNDAVFALARAVRNPEAQ